MANRKFATVGDKKYPLKTDAERAASRSVSPATSNSGGSTVSLPVTGSRQVLLSITIAFIVFLAAGGKIEKVIAKARGINPPAEDTPFTAQTIFAWGMLFVGLMVLADFNSTATLAVSFSYLILLAVLLEFGPTAFNNLLSMTGQRVDGGSGSGISGTSQTRKGFTA